MVQYLPHVEYYIEDFISQYSNQVFEGETKEEALQIAKTIMLPDLAKVVRIIANGTMPTILYKESKSNPFMIGKFTMGRYGGFVFKIAYKNKDQIKIENLPILHFTIGEQQLLSREIIMQPYYTEDPGLQDTNIFNIFSEFKAQYLYFNLANSTSLRYLRINKYRKHSN